MKIVYCLIFLLPCCVLASNLDKGWKKHPSKRGYSVYTREESNSDIVGIRVEGVVNAPIESILSNMRLVEGSEKWTPALRKKVTIKNTSDLEAITYTLNKMPWPLWDRELILHNILKLDKEKKLLYVLSKSVHKDYPNYPKEKETIMADIRYSNMGFRPIGPNKTFIELTAFVDPKGSIPAWMVNFYQKKWPIKFLTAIEKRANVHKPPLLPGIQAMLDDLRSVMKK